MKKVLRTIFLTCSLLLHSLVFEFVYIVCMYVHTQTNAYLGMPQNTHGNNYTSCGIGSILFTIGDLGIKLKLSSCKTWCLVDVSELLLWLNTTTKSNLERKGFILLTETDRILWEKPKQQLKLGRNQETEANTEAMEGCCYTSLFLMVCSVCFLIESSAGGITQMGWVFYTTHWLRRCFIALPMPEKWKHFFQLRFPPLRWLSLCQVDIKLASTVRAFTNWNISHALLLKFLNF